jgi:hypothetical protein
VPAGYSGTPLVKKLGIGSGSRVKTVKAPAHYQALLAPIPEGAHVSARLRGEVDLWHVFATSRRELQNAVGRAMSALPNDGAIWVSWPKKSSGVPTDVTEDVVREVALPLGLVDVKVCAVDETWSGLKLVIRRDLRGR